MVQFNLLPNVKLEYIKTRRTKRLVILGAILAGGAALAVFLVMVVTVDVVQKKSMNDLDRDTIKYTAQLKGIPDLDKMLTVQNQLNTLTGLHDQKIVASRTFTYISQLVPKQASLNELNIDYQQNSISMSGKAPSLDVINSFVDGIKATKYTTDAAGSTAKPAFSDVVLASFSRASDSASFTVTFNFDPTIYNSAANVKLNVPNGTTSPSETLFQKAGS